MWKLIDNAEIIPDKRVNDCRADDDIEIFGITPDMGSVMIRAVIGQYSSREKGERRRGCDNSNAVTDNT